MMIIKIHCYIPVSPTHTSSPIPHTLYQLPGHGPTNQHFFLLPSPSVLCDQDRPSARGAQASTSVARRRMEGLGGSVVADGGREEDTGSH